MVNGELISHSRGFPYDVNLSGGRITGFGTAKTHLEVGDQVMIIRCVSGFRRLAPATYAPDYNLM